MIVFSVPSQFYVVICRTSVLATLVMIANETCATMFGIGVAFRTGLLIDLCCLQLGFNAILKKSRLGWLRRLGEDREQFPRQADTHVE